MFGMIFISQYGALATHPKRKTRYNIFMLEYRRSFIPGGTDFHRGDLSPVRADGRRVGGQY